MSFNTKGGGSASSSGGGSASNTTSVFSGGRSSSPSTVTSIYTTTRRSTPTYSGRNYSYPSTVRCLYHEDGSPVYSLYARDARRYGRGGPGGKGTPVCYRTKSGTPAVTIPPKVTKGFRGCTSIYDLYGSRVCFVSIPVARPKPKPCMPPEEMAKYLKLYESWNPEATARIKKWSANYFCKIHNIAIEMGDSLEAFDGTPCQAQAYATFVLLVANLGDNISASGGKDKPADPNIDAVAGFIDKVLTITAWPGTTKTPEAISDFAAKMATKTMEVGQGFETQMFILGVGDMFVACSALMNPEQPVIDVIDETVVVDEGEPTQIPTMDPISPGPFSTPETTPAPILDAPVNTQTPTTAPVQQEEGLDKKTLLIGGILAAVVVGGIAIAATRKK